MSLSTEQELEELLPRQPMLLFDFPKECAESACSQGGMVRNSDAVPTRALGGEAPVCVSPHNLEIRAPSQAVARSGRAAASCCRGHFVPHEMQPDHRRRVRRIEVASYGVPNSRTQTVQVIGLGENGFAEGARRVPAFRRFLDDEDDLGHAANLKSGFPCVKALRRIVIMSLLCNEPKRGQRRIGRVDFAE